MPALIGNRYRVLRPLGRGATAEVFAVEDQHRGNQQMALKLLFDAEQTERLGERLALQATLRHDNLAALYDTELAAKRPYLTLELVEGPDLATWAKGRSEQQRVTALAALLGPLCLLHERGWIHGDLKPANVLVGVGDTPKLIDLGLAAREGQPAGGTLGYAAPELMSGAGATPQVDVYAFAAMAMELLTGHRPFGDDPATVVARQLAGPPPRDQLPEELGALLGACLAEDPARRPADAPALLEALRSATGRRLSLISDRLPSARLVGRETPRDRITAALERATAGAGAGACTVFGPEGSGKSRMLAEARALGVERGFACFAAPTLGELLADLAGAVGHGASPVLTRSLAAMLAGLVTVPGLPQPSADLDTSPGDVATRLRGALFELTTHAARIGPTLLLIDDLDQRHASERDAITTLVSALAELADETAASLPLVCVVGSARPLERTECLALEPLAPAQVARMVRSMLPGVSVAEAVCDAIARASDGIPWLVVESLLLWRRSPERPGTSIELPDRAQAIAARRLAGVAGPRRRAAELLALAPELDARVLFQLVDDLTADDLGSLATARILDERPANGITTVRLCGNHLRQALLDGLAPPSRRAAHLDLAGALEEIGAPPAAIARHLELAGQRHRAAGRYLEAARARNDHQAGRWAARAAELGGPDWPDRADARRVAAAALRAAGDLPRARDQLIALHSDEHADRFTDDDRLALAWLRDALGEPDEALRLLEPLSSDDVRLLRARALLRSGALERAHALCEQLPPSGEADNLRGLIAHARGELDHAAAALGRARDDFEARDEPGGLSKAMINLAVVEQARGNLTAAARWYDEALERSDQAGDYLRALHCRLNHATVSQLQGQLGRALEGYRQAISEARRLGHLTLARQARLNLASLLIELGELDQASVELDACAQGPAAQAPGHEIFVALNQAALAAARADLKTAERWLTTAEARARVEGGAIASVETSLGRARVALLGSDLEHAHQLARQAREEADRHDFAQLADEARLLLAVVARRQPTCDLKRQRERLRRVVRGMEQRGERGRIWLAYHELATIEALLGEELDARYHRAKAGASVDQLLEGLPAAPRRTLLNRPELREVYASTRGAATSPARDAVTGGVAPDATGDATALLRINLELARVREPEQLVQLILDQAITLTGAQRGMLLLVDGDVLRVAAARNLDQESIRLGSELFSERLAQEVIGSGRPLCTVDALSDARFASFASVHSMRLRSVLCAPLKIWGSVAGAIYLDNRFLPDAFSERHGELLEGFGAQAGLALDAARLLEQERQRARELAAARDQVEQLTRELQQKIERQSVELEQAVSLVRAQRRELGERDAFAEIIGESPAIRRVLELVDKISHTEIPVYIYGDSGTGKELVARAIHRTSPRAAGPLVTVNCGGLAPQLLASELFGHRRGAFTGATRDHPGLVRTAEGGTLFLDEVTEMPPELQVQLLRVLQTGDYRPVGSDEVLQADVRIISASNVDLEQAVASGRMRQDLAYRINVMRVDLPPLDERREDIPLLIQHFLDGLPIHRRALAALLSHHWPGNVRELANELERAKALATDEIQLDDLSERIACSASIPPEPTPSSSELAALLAHTERQALLAALERAGFNATRAAKALGISRSGLYVRLARHGISPDDYRPS